MYGYIYITTNKITGKIYIGQKKGVYDCDYFGSGKYISRSVNKHGKESFENNVIEWCKDKHELNQREIYWIKKYNSTDNNIGYNISTGGIWGGIVGLSEEDKQKYKKRLSESSKRVWRTMPEEKRIKFAKNASKVHKGKKLSEETKRKISISAKNRLAITGGTMKNKNHRDESKDKMREAWVLRKNNGFNNNHLYKCTKVTLPNGDVKTFETRKGAYEFVMQEFGLSLGFCKNLYKSKKEYVAHRKENENVNGLKIECIS